MKNSNSPMQQHYSPAYPLGFNAHWRSPEIPYYMSWDEVAETVRTGIITDISGRKYYLPEHKEDRPLFTYKGDFGSRRNNAGFTGEHSPYVAIDIDVDQKASNINKYSLSAEQKVKAESDLNILLDQFSGGTMDYFFCKRSSSGCGLHIIINLVDVPEGKFGLYERHILNLFADAIKKIETSLHYRYSVDMAMTKLSQALGISHDPALIFNPDKKTRAYMYTPAPEYGERGDDKEQRYYPPRKGHRLDRLNFTRLAEYCSRAHKRLSYDDIFRLSLVFFQLWPDAGVLDYMQLCRGLNEARAEEKGEDNLRFFNGEYANIKRRLNTPYKDNPVTINSLYYMMNLHGYAYQPDKELHFCGYLESIEDALFESFRNNEKILLEAATGGGKTRTLFKYLKELARAFPRNNFVVALPYIGMAEQFCSEYTDDEFQIRLCTGDKDIDFANMVEAGIWAAPEKPKGPVSHPVFELSPEDLLREKLVPQYMRSIKRKGKAKKKGRRKKGADNTQSVKLIENAPQPKIKRHNLWCTTYDSACKIKSIHTLVIDESHDLIAQLEFRSDAIDSLERIRCQKKIMITATPERLMPETLEGWHYVKCVKDDAVKPKLTIERVRGGLSPAVKNNIAGVGPVLTFWNHKQECEKLQEELLEDGVDAKLYNSDTSREQHQDKLKKESILSDCAIATSYISEGVNVLNTVNRINIVDDYSISNIRQASARPRKCVPDVRVILKDTDYLPGTWEFIPVREYITELTRLEGVAEKLTELHNTISLDRDENLFKAFEDDEPFLKYDSIHHRYTVRENKVKAAITTHYLHWYYHKKRERWESELSQYFDVVATIKTQNEEKNHKRTPPCFEEFRDAGHEMIMNFRAHRIKANDKRRKKKEKYSPEMKKWSREHNHIELSPEWQKWTERFYKMYCYNAVDLDIIGSGQKYCYWQRQADMAVSVREDGSTAKELRTSEMNKAVIEYLLSIDFANVEITKPELYRKVKDHIAGLGGKQMRLKERPFWNSLKNMLKVKVKQTKSGWRIVKEITDIRTNPTYSTGKLEMRAKEQADEKKKAQTYQPLTEDYME